MKSINTIALFTGLFWATVVLCGCTKYSETETPAGTVPPAPVQSTVGSPSTFEGQVPSEVSQPLSRKAREARKVLRQEIISNFAKVYAAKGSPRIAIFLNRALSDEVRQWRAEQRVVISGEGKKVSVAAGDNIAASDAMVNIQSGAVNIQSGTAKGSAEVEGSEDKQRAMSVQSEEYIEEEKRYGPGEQWMWAFEDGALEPFLEAKAHVIDRATILRLVAAKAVEGKNIQPITVKQIEMDALKGNADIFIELLVSRFMYSPYGYEFKAAVKEVKTGKVLANVTSADWRGKRQRGRVVIATENGYQLGGGMRLPAVKDVASDLAMDVMDRLIDVWSE